jgi:hypothetical protein
MRLAKFLCQVFALALNQVAGGKRGSKHAALIGQRLTSVNGWEVNLCLMSVIGVVTVRFMNNAIVYTLTNISSQTIHKFLVGRLVSIGGLWLLVLARAPKVRVCEMKGKPTLSRYLVPTPSP